MIKEKILDRAYTYLSRQKRLDPLNVINVFADPRSGSTWLAELLKTIPNSFILDEPLHLDNAPVFKELGFCWRQHIPEEASWKLVEDVFRTQIFAGKMLSYNLCNKNKIREIWKGTTLINKFIRGKALLPWLTQNFKFNYVPIVLVRHPVAMIASMKKHKAWAYDFEQTPFLTCPYPDLYNDHLPFMSSLETKEAQLIAYWCINNNLVLKHSQNNKKWLSLNYEDLVLNPEQCISAIFEAWSLEVPSELLHQVRLPSQTTIDDSQLNNPNAQIRKWEKEVSDQELKSYESVLDYFGVSYYSINSSSPIVKAAEVTPL